MLCPVSILFLQNQLERLFQYKMMTDRFESLTWGADVTDDKSQTSYCATGGGCKGHHPYDVTVAGAIVRGPDGVYENVEGATNYEVRDAITPDTYSAPYIYDSFTWDHCTTVTANDDDPISFPPVA